MLDLLKSFALFAIKEHLLPAICGFGIICAVFLWLLDWTWSFFIGVTGEIWYWLLLAFIAWSAVDFFLLSGDSSST